MKTIKLTKDKVTYEYPLADKQEKHSRLGITGLVWADYFRMKELPEDKDAKWSEKGFNRIYNLASFRAEQQQMPVRQLLHSTRWMVLFNQPNTYVIYTNKCDSSQIGIIKFCVTHGIKVALEDTYSGIKKVYQPVCNLYNEDLFKTMKLDNLIIKDLDKATADKALKKRKVLDDARQKFMRKVWFDVNEELYDLLRFYKLDKIDSSLEALIWYERYTTQEILQAYGAAISIYDLDKPEVFNAVATEVNVWGNVWDIRVKTESSLPTIDQFKSYVRKAAPWSDADIDPIISNRRAAIGMAKSLRRDSLQDIVNAYIQIQYYKEHMDDFFPYDTHTFCPVCNTPMSKQASHCRFCDHENTDVTIYREVEVSYDQLQYKINQDEE